MDVTNLRGFRHNISALLDSVEDCLDKRRLMSCLTLLFSGIDVVAGLERKPTEGTQASFVRWVEEYLLKSRPLPCTALELYAARCGIVHAFTCNSDLSRTGRARNVIYAWGVAKAEDLAEASRIIGRDDCVAVHIRSLIDAFRCGLADYLDDLARNPQRQQQVLATAGLWLVQMEREPVETLLARYRAAGGQ